MRSGTGAPAEGAARLLAAAGGLALLLLYTYVDVGPLGPLPDMYEPFLTGDKQLTLVAQTVAVLATGYLLLTRERSPRRHRR
ncbi:hypothetical protein [Streptomyces lydicus]|uniref:hypothetical protein n=1 Tax=Streptomyces lydicus TaxID=47763 RepID=UPI0036761D08